MIKYLLLSLVVIYFVQRMRPVKGLKYTDAKTLFYLLKDSPAQMKLLDVRDQVDYYFDHIEGAINISLGRLPYVKMTQLELDDAIIIISNSKYQSKKAAKILVKNGYKNITVLHEGMFAYNQFKNNQSKNCSLRTLHHNCISR